MRRLLTTTVLLLLCGAASASAAIANVQSKALLSATNPFATDGIADVVLDSNATIGNYMVVFFSVPLSSRTVTSVVQGATSLTLCTDGSTSATQEFAGSEEQWAYCGVVGSASTAVTVTLSSAVALQGKVVVWEFSGQHASAPIEDVTIAQNSGAGDHDTGNVTTANAGSALACFLAGTTGTYTLDADFTTFASAGDGFGQAGYDLVDAVTASCNTTSVGSESTLQMIIAFAPVAAAGGGATPTLLLLGVSEW